MEFRLVLNDTWINLKMPFKNSTNNFNLSGQDLENKLKAIFESTLQVQSVPPGANYFEFGLNPILTTKILIEIQKVINRKVDIAAFFLAPTIKKLASYLLEDGESKHFNVIPIQPNGNKTPLFLVGAILSYYSLSLQMGSDQPVYGFKPPSKYKIKELARLYISKLLIIQPEEPYIIGGFCSGGIIAFEMAQQLIAAGKNVELLILFESYTPNGLLKKNSLEYINRKMITSNFDSVVHSITKYVKHSKNVLKMLRSSKEKDKNFFRRGYILKSYPEEIILFNAQKSMYYSQDEPFLGWDKYCDQKKITVCELPGNHTALFQGSNIVQISAKIKIVIQKNTLVL